MLTKVNYEELQRVISLIENSNFNIESLKPIFSGKVKNQKINEHTSSLIFEEVSKSISAIVVGSQDEKISSITFYGDINITPKQLYDTYKSFSESYLYRDDLHFYTFIEDRTHGNFILSFFEPSHKKIDVEKNNDKLSNLTIAWSRN